MPTIVFPRHETCGPLRARRQFHRLIEWDADLPLDLVARMWDDPQALLADGMKLQVKLRSTIARIVYESCLGTERCLRKITRVAYRAAEHSHAQKNRSKLPAVLWRAPWRYVRSYIFRSGWLDGWAGLRASVLSAFAAHLREAIDRELEQPVVGRCSLVHERWKQLHVFTPNEGAHAASRPETHPICSVA